MKITLNEEFTFKIVLSYYAWYCFYIISYYTINCFNYIYFLINATSYNKKILCFLDKVYTLTYYNNF